MRFLTAVVSLCALNNVVTSAPTKSASHNGARLAWSPTLAAYYEMIAQHIQHARSLHSPPSACDLSKATLPVAPTPLPFTPGMTLAHVAVGRGVQNYTCKTSTSSTTPAPIGAVANLYNASCLAANAPDVLGLMPSIVLQLPTPQPDTATLSPSQLRLSGHHYFVNPTTPIFNFDLPPSLLSLSNSPSLGIAVARKVANSTAPGGVVSSLVGIGGAPAVPWLYLQATDASTGDFGAIYRVNTAGGSPPKTCAGMPATFSVQYASVYWFYKKQ